MGPERWQQVERLFFAALEADPDERQHLLDQARSSDPELATEVEAMLVAHAESESEGLDDLLPSGPLAGELGPDPRLGARVGPYRLLERLGEGGMGTVYLAERADGEFEQRVAIKLLRAGLASAEAIARFRTEREILARLEHPNIARLLDGGVTEDGLPYLALEQVRGETLTHYCDARGLSVEDRLRLFVAICRAVHFAHQNLVVHRDLKPSNLMVTQDGTVKLLDFGIAKLLEERGGEAATRTGLLLLTPEYASPEQVRGEAITTATDVYALGLLLFELLTGARAQPLEDASPVSVGRVVCEQEPPRVSAAAATVGAARAAERSVATPLQLARRLKGDLDTLVEAALHKDPTRRYASAERLADDVERHLAGLPIEARGAGLGYRAGKFLRRHRLGVAAAALILLALVSGLLLALFGLGRARKAETAARLEAETARRVSDFLVSVFQVTDPGESRGATVTARELLDRGAARVEAELASEPQVQARLLRTMGQAYQRLGLFTPALQLLEKDLALQRGPVGNDPVEVASALDRLSFLLRRRGEYQRALDTSLEALAILEQRGALEDMALARVLNNLGQNYGNLGRLAEARPVLERSFAIQERELGPDHLDLASILNNLPVLYWQLGEIDRALPLLERALGLSRRKYGEEHPTVAGHLNNLALAHQTAQHPERAREYHEQALAMRRKIFAPDHPDIAESLNNLGNTLLQLGDKPAARAMLEEALAIRERVLGPDHAFVGATLTNLGLLYLQLDEVDRAGAALERALAIMAKAQGPDHPDLASVLLPLASFDRARGNLAQAEARVARAITLIEKTRGGNSPDLQKTLLKHADLLRALGREAEAKAAEARASQLAERELPRG